MAEITPLIAAWIRFAEEDWDDAQILARSGGKQRSICFHAQQCIEKLFKAELMRLQTTVPKTHNLRELSDLLHQVDGAWHAKASISIACLWPPLIFAIPIPMHQIQRWRLICCC